MQLFDATSKFLPQRRRVLFDRLRQNGHLLTGEATCSKIWGELLER